MGAGPEGHLDDRPCTLLEPAERTPGATERTCEEDGEPGVDVLNLQVEQTFQMFCFRRRSRVTVVVMEQFDEAGALVGFQY